MPKVGLFVTCLADLFRPNVAFSAIELLEQAGCEVVVPEAQTCCGQPAYNNGHSRDARAIARQVMTAFADCNYVVAPSGSCAAMMRLHYPRLFTMDAHEQAKANAFAERCWELSSFLVEICGVEAGSGDYAGKVAYHDGCSGLRELQVRDQPRQLLAGLSGLKLCEVVDGESCCGFGGTFCVKYPDISVRLADDKAKNLIASGADTVVAGELGCLLNIAGRLKRLGSKIQVYHLAEVLAGMTDVPSISDSESTS